MMSLPNTYTDRNETGCCAVPNIEEWIDRELQFQDKFFVRMYTRSLLYVPLNMGKVMKKLNETVDSSGAGLPPEQAMILSRDLSPWKAEQLYSVSHPVDGADNVTLNGTFLTKVFEGPYSNAGKWNKSMQDFAKERSRKLKNVYFFYTTCPKCAKHYGKNYVVGLAEVE